MKNYHVTRKLQITIPKILAKQLGIRPGDAVTFQQAGSAILVEKAGGVVRDSAKLKEAVEALAKDMVKVSRHVKTGERSLAADLSRHFNSQ
jgi:AbrB family looped-hinge helix DNA binding protein